jgi:hypothetical protein
MFRLLEAILRLNGIVICTHCFMLNLKMAPKNRHVSLQVLKRKINEVVLDYILFFIYSYCLFAGHFGLKCVYKIAPFSVLLYFACHRPNRKHPSPLGNTQVLQFSIWM